MRHGRLDDPERRVDVGLHRRIEILGREVADGGARLLPAGIADQDVKTAELADRAIDQLLTELFVPYIAGDRDTLSCFCSRGRATAAIASCKAAWDIYRPGFAIVARSSFYFLAPSRELRDAATPAAAMPTPPTTALREIGDLLSVVIS
jgi:hypothetical protein